MIMDLLNIQLVTAIILALPNTGCSDLSTYLLSTDAMTHLIKLNLITKGIDATNLPSTFRSKSVIETVPNYFKEKEPPISSKIFNF